MVPDLMVSSIIVADCSHYQYRASTIAEAGMYQFVDQPLARLEKGSGFVLGAMRAWSNSARRYQCPRAAISGAFRNVGAGAALADFHAAMRRLRHARPALDVAPLACMCIGEGEAVLLALWQDVAAGAHDKVLAALRLIVPAVCADQIGESLAGAVDHLRQAGLTPLGLASGRTSNIGGVE